MFAHYNHYKDKLLQAISEVTEQDDLSWVKFRRNKHALKNDFSISFFQIQSQFIQFVFLFASNFSGELYGLAGG